MAWRAFIRMGWSFAANGEHRELVNRKTNDYPAQESVIYDWSWSRTLPPRKTPPDLEIMGKVTRSPTDRIFDVFARDESITPEEITSRVNEDGLRAVACQTVRNTLSKSDMFEVSPGDIRGLWQTIPLPDLIRRAGLILVSRHGIGHVSRTAVSNRYETGIGTGIGRVFTLRNGYQGWYERCSTSHTDPSHL